MFQGHAYIDITTTRTPYQYCLHCGKIREPGFVIRNRILKSRTVNE
jgi:hypothetical protein